MFERKRENLSLNTLIQYAAQIQFKNCLQFQ